ncbi:MAG: helix-turn-helix domain-containing protein [Lachnospiraceae bacterium]|nr:helix-turn-helix domain-containing protein [Lachnospiraceae bacterium]
MDIKRELNHKLYAPHEDRIRHIKYEQESAFYKAIASGNLKRVEEGLKNWENTNGFTTSENKCGILSKDPLQNRKYHFVILTALITRFCIDSGLNQEIAYNMSDIYILQTDSCTSIRQIEKLTRSMVMGFAEKMREDKKKHIYSKQIIKCIDYIYDNLNQSLHVDEIAAVLNVTPSYLSRLFSKEVGVSLSSYIKNLRLETAAQMLIYSNYEISEISAYLLFSSQSHFTTAFQKKYGQTPKRYRNENASSKMPTGN